MSATLTNEQFEMLKTEFLYGEKCVTFTQGVHRDNMKFHLRKYQYKRQKEIDEHYSSDTDDGNDNDDDSGIKVAKYTGRMTIADRNEAEKSFLHSKNNCVKTACKVCYF